MKKQGIVSSVLILLFLLFASSENVAFQMSHSDQKPSEQATYFQRIEQPLWLKATVTTGGIGLIALELWWFVFSKPKSRQNNL